MNKKELNFILQQGEGQYYNPSSLINSEVVNTLTEGCFFRALSSDHNGMFLESESAIKGASSGCETSFNANLMNFLNSSSGTMFILDSKNVINTENSYLFMPDLEIISCSCAKDSEIIYSGACNTSFGEQINSLDFDDLIKADIKTLVSTAISNYTNSLYCFFHIDNLIFFPNSKASCSVSLLLDTIVSNNSICDAFSLNACLATSDQLISKCLFITTFNSSGTDKVILTILNTSNMCDMCNNVQIYKTSDFVKESEAMNVSKYAFDSGQSEVFFVDASNNIGISTLEQNQILNFGSGFARMKYYCKKENAPVPKIRFTDILFYVVFRQNLEYLKLKAVKVGEKLTENQKKIIQFISKKPYVSARELSTLVGISSRKIEENIVKLKKKGLLKRVGPAKGGYWEIILSVNN